jgi:hypothetical protein
MSHVERTERYARMLINVGAPATPEHCNKLADARRSRAKAVRRESRFSTAARDERFVMLVTARAFYAVARRVRATITGQE